MKKRLLSLFLCLTMCLMLTPTCVRAASAPIVIDYSGGTNLTSVAAENADAVAALIEAARDGKNVIFSETGWLQGYYWTNAIKDPVYYISAAPGETTYTDVWWRYVGEHYDTLLTLNRLYNTGTRNLAFAVVAGDNETVDPYYYHAGAIDGLISIRDENNKVLVNGISQDDAQNGKKLFAEFTVQMLKTGTDEVIPLNKCYYKFMDIDAGGSFHVEGVTLSSDTLLIADSSVWPSTDAPYQNKVTDSAIYSEYERIDGTNYSFQAAEADEVDAYVRIKDSANGATIVYGYGLSAGVGFGIYIVPVTVNYESDEHGSITGPEIENMIEDSTPVGTKDTPDPGYSFSHWVAGEDITLNDTDSTVIPAGAPITDKQLRQAIISAEISGVTFTSVHTLTPYTVEYAVVEDPVWGVPADSTVPTDPTVYHYLDTVTVKDDLTTVEGSAVNSRTEETVPGSWTFTPWDHKDFQITENTTITGSWTFTPDTYNVDYAWTGGIPSGVTLPTDGTAYDWHDVPTADGTYDASTSITGTKSGIPGVYTFSGWDASRDSDLTPDGMEGDVTFKGEWTFTPDTHIHTPGGGRNPTPPTPGGTENPEPTEDPKTPTPGGTEDPEPTEDPKTPTPGGTEDPEPTEDPKTPTPGGTEDPEFTGTPETPSAGTDPVPGPTLPQTGLLWWPVCLLLTAGLLCMAFGLLMRRKRN